LPAHIIKKLFIEQLKGGFQLLKKQWIKPSLVILIRQNKGEHVLAFCKVTGQWPGPPAALHGACLAASECGTCHDPGSS
jgi:hypothetical protein